MAAAAANVDRHDHGGGTRADVRHCDAAQHGVALEKELLDDSGRGKEAQEESRRSRGRREGFEMFPCGGFVGTAGAVVHSLAYVGSEVSAVEGIRGMQGPVVQTSGGGLEEQGSEEVVEMIFCGGLVGSVGTALHSLACIGSGASCHVEDSVFEGSEVSVVEGVADLQRRVVETGGGGGLEGSALESPEVLVVEGATSCRLAAAAAA